MRAQIQTFKLETLNLDTIEPMGEGHVQLTLTLLCFHILHMFNAFQVC